LYLDNNKRFKLIGKSLVVANFSLIYVINKPHLYFTGTLENLDNDGLWTAMYLAAEAFRYVVTKSDEALQNVRESLDAMERF
jgi:hypothetical protein